MDSLNLRSYRIALFGAGVAALAVVLVAFVSLSGTGSADHIVHVEVGIDADATGNTPRTIQYRDACREVGIGETVDIDVYVTGVPKRPNVYTGINGFIASLEFDPAKLRVVNVDMNQLLVQEPNGSLFSYSDDLPDNDGSFYFTALDIHGHTEEGDGILARISVETISAGLVDLKLKENTSPSGHDLVVFDYDTVPYELKAIHVAQLGIGEAQCPPAQPTPTTTTPQHGYISGRVVNRQGEAIPFADLDFANEAWHDEKRANALGEYVIELPNGEYDVRAEAFGYHPGCWSPDEPAIDCFPAADRVVVRGGETTSGIDVVLGRRSVVRGIVTDSLGAPLERVQVWMGGSYTETDTSGRYSITVWSDGDQIAQALPLYGHVSEYWTADGGTTEESLAEPIAIKNGTDQVLDDINFSLTRLAEIKGTVTDQQGRAISRVMVRVTAEGGYPNNSNETDENGHYSFLVEPGTYRVSATPYYEPPFFGEFWTDDGGSSEESGATSIGVTYEQTFEANFALDRPASISGVVVDTAGVPVTNGAVSTEPNCGWSCSAGMPDRITGEYRITWLRPGTYRLYAGFSPELPLYWTADGGHPFTGDEIVVREGDNLTGYNLVLTEGGWIAGSVKDPSGKPITSARIQAFGGTCEPCGAWAHWQSGFYGVRWYPGTYKVRAFADGYVGEWWTANGGTQDVSQAAQLTIQDGEFTTADFVLEAISTPRPTRTPVGAVAGPTRTATSTPTVGAATLTPTEVGPTPVPRPTRTPARR